MIWIDLLFDILYPPRCMFCGELLTLTHNHLTCAACLQQLPWIQKHQCEKCGKQLAEKYSKPLCPDCSKIQHAFDKGVSCFIYEKEVMRALRYLKFKGKKYYGKHLGYYMVQRVQQEDHLNSYDMIIPVPISKKKRKIRGYNQTEILAGEIAESLQIPLDNHCLQKVKDTPSQRSLPVSVRKYNVKNIVCVHWDRKPIPESVLLVDDIYTTGNTVDACAEILKKSGVKRVDVLTLASGMNT